MCLFFFLSHVFTSLGGAHSRKQMEQEEEELLADREDANEELVCASSFDFLRASLSLSLLLSSSSRSRTSFLLSPSRFCVVRLVFLPLVGVGAHVH